MRANKMLWIFTPAYTKWEKQTCRRNKAKKERPKKQQRRREQRRREEIEELKHLRSGNI